MDIFTICNRINLNPEMTKMVLEEAKTIKPEDVEEYIDGFYDFATMHDSTGKLFDKLGDDPFGAKALLCMLYGAIEAYGVYKQKGIPDKIYFDTMACFARFVDEVIESEGVVKFDRQWWTPRQVGCHLFRIGTLEYEVLHKDDTVITIHIPSNADFSPKSVGESIEAAKQFYKSYYPEYADCKIVCRSWLMDPQLKGMLREGSNILSFQDRFDLADEGYVDKDGFITWIFKMKTQDYSILPESTSLQRNMKKHIMEGGVVRCPRGVLKS